MSEGDPLPEAETRVKALTAGELRGLAARDPTAQRIGPYVLQHRLGAGGMAEVFLAFNEGSDVEQQIVIKRIHPHYATEPRYVEMFRREASVSMGLDHPNIVRVFGLVEDAGQVGLVMEYLEGLTLFDLALRSWRAGKSLPLEPLLTIFLMAARALSHAHRHPDEHGVMRELVHRDVSPDNLLVTKQGQTKLLDFGVAKPEGENEGLTRAGQIKGKVSYMSPEQVRGEKLDGRSDLFSLGTTFYWLLTGIRPFDRESPVATMEAVVLADIPRPTELNPKIPRDLEIVVLRLLERDRRFRTPNGTDLEKQLGQLLERVPGPNASPKWLLQEVLSLPEGPAMPRPEFPAIPTIDWHSGERMSLMRDPSMPNPLDGNWADVDTAQFPVFGRMVDPSSNFGEVFTESTLLAVEAPGDAGGVHNVPVPVDIQDAATVPAGGRDSAELEEIARAAAQEVAEHPDTIRVPTSLPSIAPIEIRESRLGRKMVEGRPTIQMASQDDASLERGLELSPVDELGDIHESATVKMQSAADIDLHVRDTLQMKSAADIDVHVRDTLQMKSAADIEQASSAFDLPSPESPLEGGPTLQMPSAEHDLLAQPTPADEARLERPTVSVRAGSGANAASGPKAYPPPQSTPLDPLTIPVPSSDTIPSHIDTASGPSQASGERPALAIPPATGPDTIPDMSDEARGLLRAEDISVPSSPVVKTVPRKRGVGLLLFAALVGVGLAAAGAWLALQYAQRPAVVAQPVEPIPVDPKPDDTKPDDTKPDDPKPDDPKPDDPKPDDPKPDETKPDDTKPDDPKPDDTKPDEPKPDQPKPDQPKPRTKPAVVLVDVSVKGAVSWRVPGGKKVKAAAGVVSVPAGTRALSAVDGKRGVTVTVPIVSGVADYNALKTEEITVRARPWANVTLGREKIGQTPFAPIRVAPGRYVLTLEWEDKSTQRTVVAKKGGGQTVIAIDMRSLP